MSIKSTRKNRSFLIFAVLAVLLVTFSACSSGGGGGGPAPDAGITVTINGEPPDISDGLLICALNEIVVSWDPNRDVVIDQVRLQLTGYPTATGDNGFYSGFTEDDDYQTAAVTMGPVIFGVSPSSFTINFMADVPDDSGDYVVEITVTANDTFTDFPSVSVSVPTAENPCLVSFSDPEPAGEGYAADPPEEPVEGEGVPGEMVTITGYNISDNPDEFFLFDDPESGPPNEYVLDDLQPVDTDSDGLVTITGVLTPGCGQDLFFGMRHKNETPEYPHPMTSPYIDVSAQTLYDFQTQNPLSVYTYTPVITAIYPDLGTCDGGTEISIYGGGFLDGATVEIDGNPLGDPQYNDCSQISGFTPDGCGEGLSVTVDNTDDNTDAFTKYGLFSYTPEIFEIDPVYGPFAGGTVFEITGCGFLNDEIVGFEYDTIVTVAGNPPPSMTTTEVIDCETITATTPRHEDDHLGEPPGNLVVPVEVENNPPDGHSAENMFTYRSRNINSDETNYSNASLLGKYNWIAISHDFGQFVPNGEPGPQAINGVPNGGEPEVFVTAVGSRFKPEFAPIDGGTADFKGDGTFEVSAGADEFYVWNDGVPTLANVNAPAVDEGFYDMETAEDGTLTISDYKSGALGPDGNALFVASTMHQVGGISELYVFAREGLELDPIIPVDLNGKRMGVVAFVHDYGSEDYGIWELTYGFKGIMSFGTTSFTLTALEGKVLIDDGEFLEGAFFAGDDMMGEYSADTSGLFSLTFNTVIVDEVYPFFNGDKVFGIFTVNDGENPEDAQLFAGVNLATPPAAVLPPIFFSASSAESSSYPSATGGGRSLILFMVPLSTDESKNASSFAIAGEMMVEELDEGEDMGWTQGLFGHEFNEGNWVTLWTRDTAVSYVPTDDYIGGVTEDVTAGARVFADPLTWTTLIGAGEIYSYEVFSAPYDGEFVLDESGEGVVQGFISEDDSVNVNVDMNEADINTIRLELEK